MVGSRGRYTRHACEACKLSKRKCDGHSPCGRCDRLGEECVYTVRASKPTAAVKRGAAAPSRRRGHPVAAPGAAAKRRAARTHACEGGDCGTGTGAADAAAAEPARSQSGAASAAGASSPAAAAAAAHAASPELLPSHAQRVRAHAAEAEMEELLASNVALGERIDALQRECAAWQRAALLGVGLVAGKRRRHARLGAACGMPLLVVGEGMVVAYASSELADMLRCEREQLMGARLECLGDDGMQLLKDTFVAQLRSADAARATAEAEVTWSTVLPEQALSWHTGDGHVLTVPTVVDIAVLRGVPRITFSLERVAMPLPEVTVRTKAASDAASPTSEGRVVQSPPLAPVEAVAAAAEAAVEVAAAEVGEGLLADLFTLPFAAAHGTGVHVLHMGDDAGMHCSPTVLMGSLLPTPDFLLDTTSAATGAAAAAKPRDGAGTGKAAGVFFDDWHFADNALGLSMTL